MRPTSLGRASRPFGGTLGSDDDTTCIQNTLDAAYEAGGGVVVLPARSDYVYRYSQLVIPKFVRFTGGNWHTFGADGSISRLQQLSGVNDDSIIFTNTGTEGAATNPFGPCGISDLAIRGAVSEGATAGHAIAFRESDGTALAAQDLTTFDRINIRGFAESGIYVTLLFPLYMSNIFVNSCGEYGIHIDAASSQAIHLVKLTNIGGQGCMGGEADAAGATLKLSNIKSPTASVVVNGLKTEYRLRSTSDGGDGSSYGCKNAIIIDDCSAAISLSGIQHISTSTSTRKPGNVIEVTGPDVPQLQWSAVAVRDNIAGQVDGDDPFTVYDDQNSVGYSTAHGMLTATVGDVTMSNDGDRKLLITSSSSDANSVAVRVDGNPTSSSGTQYGLQVQQTLEQSGTAGYTGLDVNVKQTTTGSGTVRIMSGRLDNSTKFAVNTDGSIELGHGSDTTISRAAAGQVSVENNPIGIKVSVPASAAATGAVGQWAADSSYIYVCTAANTWKRAAIAAW